MAARIEPEANQEPDDLVRMCSCLLQGVKQYRTVVGIKSVGIRPSSQEVFCTHEVRAFAKSLAELLLKRTPSLSFFISHRQGPSLKLCFFSLIPKSRLRENQVSERLQ